MASNELYPEEISEPTDAGVDEVVSAPNLGLGTGVSAEDDGFTLEGDADDFDFGADEADPGRLDISAQPGAPALERVEPVDDLDDIAPEQRAAGVEQPYAEDKEVDPEPEDKRAETASHVPRIEHDEETGTVRASIAGADGEHGRINAHLTQRGEDDELVVDEMNVARMDVDTDVPAWLLANLADASASEGVRTIDSKVGSVRALDIRAQVFGEGNLEFHDPEAKDGDTTLQVNVDQARAYLQPGDRTPLSVRATLPSGPDRQQLASRYDQDEIAAQLNPPAEAAVADEDETAHVVEAADDAQLTEAADEVTEPAADVEVQEEQHDIDIPEQPRTSAADNETSPDGRIVDEASYNAFYGANLSFVEHVLVSRGASRVDAEDIAQTAFERAWRNRESFDGQNARAWVTRIAVNESINRHRAVERGPKQVTDDEQLDSIFRNTASGEPLPEEVATTNDENERLMHTLREAKLPGHWTQILMMKHGYGLSEKEISERLGISRGSVASGASRALARVRELMLVQS